MKNKSKVIAVIIVAVGAVYLVLDYIAKKKRADSVFDNDSAQKNPMEGKKVIFVEDENDQENADGVKGHLEAVEDIMLEKTVYDQYIKRSIDKTLAFGSLVILSPIFLGIALAIKIEDGGPVFFTQKRIGENKQYFKMHKFRSMRIDAPHDVPTHMLHDSDQFITKVGRFLRAHSLDELPQIWDIFMGSMTIIGPRPALWNQDKLIALRDQYGANNIKPGLTGWAQINGRDRLKLEDKARLDGEYAKNRGFLMDVKCFLKSLPAFGKDAFTIKDRTDARSKENTGKKRVLFLVNHFITLYAFRKELIQKLVEEGHQVYVSLPKDENDYFSRLGCHILLTDIDRRGMNPKNDLKLIRFYQKMIPKVDPDIIFSYTIKPNIYGTIVTNGKYKQICNITGTGGVFLKDNIVARICKFLYKRSVRKCYKVFFQNTGDCDFFIKNGLVSHNYEILPGSGCNLEEYKRIPMPSEDEITRFIFIGRVMKLKGIDEYLEAAKRMKKTYPDTEFLIAGWNEEKEYQNIIEEYQSKNIVRYIGFQNDIAGWIAKCNCTVLPSHGGEGIPNVLLESAATGRALIGSNINGIVNVIDDGVNGYLFEAGSADCLFEAMEKFLNLSDEEKDEMGQAAREKVEHEFDRNIVIDKYRDEVVKA